MSGGGAAASSGVIEIDPRELVYNRDPAGPDFLGAGSFGLVYRAHCRGKAVAVKVPKVQQLSDKRLADFRHEIQVMSRTFHPNVVLFMGACTVPGKFIIVTELMSTDLEQVLLGSREARKARLPVSSLPALPLALRLRIGRDAALGMAWLHGISKIVHRDLKPANILLSPPPEHTVKLTDFGFAELRPTASETLEDGVRGARGTPLWMAPEIMCRKPFTEAVDIYAFGIILWQLLTRQAPFSHHRDLGKFKAAVCKRGERPPMPPTAPRRLASLIVACWDADPAVRPPATVVASQLTDCLIDAIIDDEDGADFWRDSFASLSTEGGSGDAMLTDSATALLTGPQDLSSSASLADTREMRDSVPWDEFERALRESLVWPDSSAIAAAGGGASLDLTELRNLLAPITDWSIDAATAAIPERHVHIETFSHAIRWFGPFYSYTEGPRILALVTEMAKQLWFHGNITKNEAEKRLGGRGEGTFLVRLSTTTPGCPFTISTIRKRDDGTFFYEHRRVCHEAPGAPFFPKGSPDKMFSSLSDLVTSCAELRLGDACPDVVEGWGYTGYESVENQPMM